MNIYEVIFVLCICSFYPALLIFTLSGLIVSNDKKNKVKNRFILSPSFIDEAVPELESLAKQGWFINNPSLPNGDRQLRMSAIHKIIADFVSETVCENERPVSIAGDCCTAIGVLARFTASRD